MNNVDHMKHLIQLVESAEQLDEINLPRMLDIIDKSKQPKKPEPYFSVDNRIPKSPRIDKNTFKDTVSKFQKWQQLGMLAGVGDMAHKANDIARELWQVYTGIPLNYDTYAGDWMTTGNWNTAVSIVANDMGMSDAQAKQLSGSLAKYGLKDNPNS